jgi:hypothetical protein
VINSQESFMGAAVPPYYWPGQLLPATRCAGLFQSSAINEREDESFEWANAQAACFSEWSVAKGVTNGTSIGKPGSSGIAGTFPVLRKPRRIATVSRWRQTCSKQHRLHPPLKTEN